jgi:hypothetical protein
MSVAVIAEKIADRFSKGEEFERLRDELTFELEEFIREELSGMAKILRQKGRDLSATIIENRAEPLYAETDGWPIRPLDPVTEYAESIEANLAQTSKTLELCKLHGVRSARFSPRGVIVSATFHPPAPPPFVVAPGEKNEAQREPDGVELAALKLQGRARRPPAQGPDGTG